MARALYGRAATASENDPNALAKEMRAFGASEEDIEAAHAAHHARADRDTIEVHEDCWDTVQLFDAMRTQWRRAGLQGHPVGLDYNALEPVARALDIEIPPIRFQELRLMEQVAIREIAKATTRGERAASKGGRGRNRRRGRRR